MQYELSCKTATGKEFPIDHIVATSFGTTSILYIEFIDVTMMDIVPVFSNSEETNHIYGLSDGEVAKEYVNYTNLIEANIIAMTGNLRIALTAPKDVFGA